MTERNEAPYVLSNGRYTVRLTASGTGYSELNGRALTRWSPDPTRERDGFHIYIRDLDTGRVWSAGLEPAPLEPRHYECRVDGARAVIHREDEDIALRLEIEVPADEDAEVRRLTLTNRGAGARRLEVTTYAEVVLADRVADAAHPAFSKLFLQTAWVPEHEALLAWRRPRSPDEPVPWLAHRLIGPGVPLQYETDRARFLGRGRDVRRPRALEGDAPLSGTVGNVLDPVLSLRRAIVLESGESATLAAVLAAGLDRETVLATVARLGGGARGGKRRDGAVEDGPAHLAMASPHGPQHHETGGEPVASVLGAASTAGASAAGSAGALTSPSNAAASTRPSDSEAIAAASTHTDRSTEPLQFFNGYGGFSEDGSEYVIRLEPDGAGLRLPPAPWINVVANETCGFLSSETGAGYTWAGNSREHRLTPWSNDPVTDPHGEAWYLRDEDDGAVWSPTPGPAPGGGAYEARHGWGYSRYRYSGRGLEHELVLFVPRTDPVKLARLRVTNPGPRPRRLAFYAYAEWVLGHDRERSARHVITRIDRDAGIIFARNPQAGDFADRVAFAAIAAADSTGGRSASEQAVEGVTATADRTTFLGRRGEVRAPAAVLAGTPLDGGNGAGIDPCAAFRVPLEVPASGAVEVTFLLGEAGSEEEARDVVARYRAAGAVDAALAEVRDFWRRMLSAVRVRTPSPALDLMLNGWALYQALSCRLWGRSAFYQSGGAFGYRDQLQDSLAFIHVDPQIPRRQILLHAAHQFVEGDVLHWWHPPASRGIRTRFSDDLLWLPYAVCIHVNATGDDALLDEPAPFLTARALEAGEDEAFLEPVDSGERGSVYEHCCRALDRSLTRGAHGLPLMGTGDWNDGMNRVGREGRGESVWLGFFLCHVLDAFIPICRQRGDDARAERYAAYRAALAAALEDAGWDGEWYRRAYYDDGTPLGSAASDECRIDAIAQAWAVLSGVASPARARQALAAVERHLVSEDDGLIRLLTPPFDRTPKDPGYIKGYVPGVRENGGQYTHGALWVVAAFAALGHADRAARLLEMLSPVSHARTPEQVERYKVEPYVIAADVYAAEPHVGRGGWTWYTGSAGWLFRVGLESVLGLRVVHGREIVLRPCIPAEWPGFTLRWRVPGSGTVYEFVVTRAGATERTSAALDGDPLRVEDGAVRLPLAADGATHRVEVRLGADAPVASADAGVVAAEAR